MVHEGLSLVRTFYFQFGAAMGEAENLVTFFYRKHLVGLLMCIVFGF